ncbi:MAG: polysaccharide deacetylase family protein [Reichenbachiella sp.]|uniref:polysaccharide deacetylase family protein n=1 Tax=Reichenbachiella sp. TaxID=2184521 RepID=UPI003264F55C
MGFYLHRIPTIASRIFPSYRWSIPNANREIYLTFDDGPTPKVTEDVLQVLQEKEVLATFFCLGSQLHKYPDLAKKTHFNGHRIANHGFDHFSGWRHSKQQFYENRSKGHDVLCELFGEEKYAFRPPYGHFRVPSSGVMWSLMSGDFDSKLSKEKCLEVLKNQTRPGDIIVFHDNTAAHHKMKWVLPRYLDFCLASGFKFGLLPND